MNKSILGIITFIFALVMGQSVYAHSSMCENKMKQMVQSLKLDAEQQKKVAVIRDQFKASQKDNWTKMKASHDLIAQQVQADTLDQAILDEAVNQQAQQIGATMKAKALMQNQIYIILNPQQKTEFVAMMKAREDKMKDMFKKCED
jgi:protein CpxP